MLQIFQQRLMLKRMNCKYTTIAGAGQSVNTQSAEVEGKAKGDWSSRRRRLHADCSATDGIWSNLSISLYMCHCVHSSLYLSIYLYLQSSLSPEAPTTSQGNFNFSRHRIDTINNVMRRLSIFRSQCSQYSVLFPKSPWHILTTPLPAILTSSFAQYQQFRSVSHYLSAVPKISLTHPDNSFASDLDFIVHAINNFIQHHITRVLDNFLCLGSHRGSIK